jgi:DNA-binding transcriptional MerR regulator
MPGTDRQLPERKQVKRALRDLGMSTRQVDALLRDGWKSLIGEAEAEAQELRERLAELQERLR